MFDKVLKYRGNRVVCTHDREIWRWRWRLWFSLLSRATNRGSNSWKFNKRVRGSTLNPSLIVLDSDATYRRGSVDSVRHGKIVYTYNRAVCHYYTWPYANQLIKIQLYSMHFFLLSAILFQVLVFFLPYLSIPRKCCRKKIKKSFDFTA